MLRPVYFACLCILAATCDAFAKGSTLATGTAGMTSWTITSPLSFVPPAGFIPVTLSATNSGAKAINARYEFSSQDFYYSSNNATVASGSLEIQPFKTAIATHWIWRGSNFRRSETQSRVRFSIKTPNGASNDTLRGADRDSGSAIAFSTAFTTTGMLSTGSSGEFLYPPMGIEVAVIDPQAIPADWRVFSSLYSLYLTPGDWDDLAPGVRDALRTWIGFGGMVGIVDDDLGQAQRVAGELIPRDSMLGLFANPDPVIALSHAQIDTHLDGLRAARNAFGIGVPATDLDRQFRYRPGRYRIDRNEARGRNQTFPLRDSFGRREIPYLAICMLLFAFAVLVGPVSLRLWAGPGKRHRLFLTTPLFSLAASALMLVVVLLQDGLGVKGRRFTVIDLAPADSAQPGALIYQEQFVRAGMVTTRGFPIEPGLMPIIPIEATDPSLVVRDNRAEGPWISSRRDRSLSLAGLLPIRWQVTLERADEQSLHLHIECPVDTFSDAWFIDGEGLVWKWDGGATDASGTRRFIPATRDPEGVMRPMFARCSTNLKGAILGRINHENQRNRFWALAENGRVGARPTDAKVKWLESQLILTSKVTPKR